MIALEIKQKYTPNAVGLSQHPLFYNAFFSGFEAVVERLIISYKSSNLWFYRIVHG
jgi:hypothetical protein